MLKMMSTLKTSGFCHLHLWEVSNNCGSLSWCAVASVGCIYCPPSISHNSLHLLEDIITECLLSSDQVICLGDFNINYLNKSSIQCKFINTFFDTFNMKQIITKPTRITPTSSTLIDLICICKRF